MGQHGHTISIRLKSLTALVCIILIGLWLSPGAPLVAQAKPLADISPYPITAPAATTYSVQWGSHNTPASLGMGLQIPVTITLTNTGSLTWPNGGNNPVSLSYHWLKDGQLVVWDGLRTALPKDLASGQSATLTANLKAPSELGNYSLKWDLVRENVTWFWFEGVEPLGTVVAVTAPPVYGVQWSEYKVIVSYAWSGKNGSLPITATNIGTLTWPKGGDNPVYLSYHWYKDGQVAVWDGWRTTLPYDVAPGQSVKLNGSLKNPTSPGEYTLKWDMVHEKVTWFSFQGAPTMDNGGISVQAPFYGLDLVSHNTPANLEAGQQVSVSVTLMNVGYFTWPKGGTNPVYLSYEVKKNLGPYSFDSYFNVFKAASLPQDVAQGQTVTLQASLKAPTNPGDYSIKWYLVHSGVNTVGEAYTNTKVASPTYGVQWGNHSTPTTLWTYQNAQASITLTNTSSITWSKFGVYLYSRWTKDGQDISPYWSSLIKTDLPEDVPPGQTVTLQAALEAPAGPGNYTVKWDLYHKDVTWFAQKGVPTLNVAVSVAAITYGVQWGSHNTPTKLTVSQQADVSLTLTNTSTFTWPKGGSKPVYLSYRWFKDGQEMSWYGYNLKTSLPQDVPPGQTVTLIAKLAGPAGPGNYTLKWDLMHENVTWFSTKGVPTLDVAITPPTYWVGWTKWNSIPSTLGTGQQIVVSVGLYNYGGFTWPKAGANPVYLSYHWFKDGQAVLWDGLRTPLFAEKAPGAGSGISLSVSLLTPSTPGNYTLKWDMVQEGVTWFSAQGVPTQDKSVTITTSTYGLEWGSHNTPTSLAVNQQVNVSVTLENVGSLTWLKGSNSPVLLSYHWLNGSQVVVWDGLRTALSHDLTAGQAATLSASLKAPAEVGNYTLKWDLVHEGVTWFSFKGAPSLGVAVSVQ